MGRYPFLGGSVSLMFYSIVRHLFRSLSNFLVLIVGFAFGFFIVHHRKNDDRSFDNPWKVAGLVAVSGLLQYVEFTGPLVHL